MLTGKYYFNDKKDLRANVEEVIIYHLKKTGEVTDVVGVNPDQYKDFTEIDVIFFSGDSPYGKVKLVDDPMMMPNHFFIPWEAPVEEA